MGGNLEKGEEGKLISRFRELKRGGFFVYEMKGITKTQGG